MGLLCDVCIVGGGPAGLSAALLLGRCRRRVVVVDDGHPRNERAAHMHGFLTRDGVSPHEFLQLSYHDLRPYPVTLLFQRAVGAERISTGFRVDLQSGEQVNSRKLLLATGVRDHLPDLPGFADCYGTTVHLCPFCDAWEHRDKALVAFGDGSAAIELALSLRTWSDRVCACSNGEDVSGPDREHALSNGIVVRTERVARLECEHSRVVRIHFHGGEPLACNALFFNNGRTEQSAIANQLGCMVKPDGGIEARDRQCTNVPGLYIAGDAMKDVRLAVSAAAEGALAAVSINTEMQNEDRGE